MFDTCLGLHCNMSVCEIDIVNSTQWCCKLSPEQVYDAMTQYNDLMCSLVKGYDVQKIELVGDSMLLISASAIQLVRLCYVIANHIEHIKKEVFRDDRIDLRIGIHVGDVFGGFLNGPCKHQLFGQAINVASRLEQLAIPGTIHVSEQLYSMIRSETALMRMFSLGKTKLHNLKGIGDMHSVSLFPKRENCLIADDNQSQVLVLGHLIDKQYNSTSVQVTCVAECFDILRKQYFDEIVVLDRFFEDIDAIPLLHEFRKWESENRHEKQQVILISADNSPPHNVDYFILKDNLFYKNFHSFFRELKKV